MQRLLWILPLLPLTFVAPACDDPDDEAMLQAEDAQAELRPANKDVAKPAGLDLSSKPDPATSGCHYKVIWPVAGVYEKPGWNNLKNKHAGDIVGEWCDWTWYDGQNEWLAVTTASAEDGIGWMRREAVVGI